MLTIYGASDDLIEVEGDITDEYPATSGEATLLITSASSGGGGCRVTMTFDAAGNGCWRAAVDMLEEDDRIPWAVRVGHTGACGYSVALEMDTPSDVQIAFEG